MIKNKKGDIFVYNNVEYKVGDCIVCTNDSEYEGLIGYITEIRDGKDKDTENETPDIYCDLMPPLLPCDIAHLEKIFSDLYEQPKTLGEIVLDCVIMAPSMIKPVNNTKSNISIPVYAVVEDWCFDGSGDHSEQLFTSYDDAMAVFQKEVEYERSEGIVKDWFDDGHNLVLESDSEHIEAYIDDDYCENHIEICIDTKEVLVSPEFLVRLKYRGGANCELL